MLKNADDSGDRQACVKQDRAFAFGEASMAAAAVEQASVLRAVMIANAEVALAALAIFLAVGIAAAMAREVGGNRVFHGGAQVDWSENQVADSGKAFPASL